MTTTDPSVASLVRVTVTTDERSADLALPAAVPVAELVPELARSLRVLDPTTAHQGFRLVTSEGVELSGSAGLTFQNVRDGAVLALTPGVQAHRRVYDDVVEAMADVVETTTAPWAAAAARRTALVAATGLLSLGALTIALERPSLIAGSLAAVVALVLLTAAVVLARLEDEAEVALVLAWCGAGYAAVGGITAVQTSSGILGWPTAAAGGAGAVLALLGALGLVRRRLLLLPAIVVGSVVALASTVVATTDFEPSQVYLTLLVVVTIAAGVQPALSLASVGASAAQPQDPTSLPDDPDEVPLDQVRESVRTGHDVLLAVTASTGLLLVLVAPLAVESGLTAMLVTVCAAVALLVRTRQFRSGTEVGVGLLTAAAGLLSVALSILVLRPDWRVGLVVVLVLLAAGTLVATLVRTDGTVTRGRAAEVIELVALVAMLPLFVIAVGIVSAVRS